MKFLCKTEYFHSGDRLYTAGTVYSDITAKKAEALIAADEKIKLGALSFFSPVDEEAVNFLKAKGAGTAQAGEGQPPPPPKPPTKAELIAEAKNLGINGTDRMNVEELKQVIAAAQAGGVTAGTAQAGEGQTQTTQV